MDCEYCFKRFIRKGALKKHQLYAKYCLKLQGKLPETIANNKKIYTCGICSKQTTKKETHDIHSIWCINTLHGQVIIKLRTGIENSRTDNEKLLTDNEKLSTDNEKLRNDNEKLCNDNEKLHKIEEKFRNRLGIDARPYYDKDVLYFGRFEPIEEIDIEIQDGKFLCKFGVSSDLEERINTHSRDKTMKDFRVVRVISGGSRREVSYLEKETKKIAEMNNLMFPYMKSKETMMTTGRELTMMIDRLNEMVANVDSVSEYSDRGCDVMKEERKAKAFDMVDRGVVTFDQYVRMMELCNN
jgi:hypothetical protein